MSWMATTTVLSILSLMTMPTRVFLRFLSLIYLRPPFGEVREDLELPVELFYVSWNIDTLDWKTRNMDSILQIVKKQIKDGSIILMHDEYETSVEAALRIVDDLTKEGYRFVTVDELLLP